MFGQAITTPPESPIPGPPQAPLSPIPEARRNVLQNAQWRTTRRNGFNLYKSYWTLEERPHDPDLFLSNSDLWVDEDTLPIDLQLNDSGKVRSANPFHPFPNWSSFKLGEWYWSDNGAKSRQSFEELVGIIGDEDFIPEDIRHTNWKRVDSLLASSEFEDDFAPETAQWAEDGTSWKTTPVTVNVPFNSVSREPGSKPFVLKEFRFRPLVPVILAKLKDKTAGEHFHIVPSELWWDRLGSGDKVRVYGDLYHSDVFLNAYREVQVRPQSLQMLIMLTHCTVPAASSRRGRR